MIDAPAPSAQEVQLQNPVIEDIAAWTERQGFTELQHGTFKNTDRTEWLYAKQCHQLDTKQDADQATNVLRDLTTKGVFHPATSWHVGRRPEGGFQLLALSPALYAWTPGRTSMETMLQEGSHVRELLQRADPTIDVIDDHTPYPKDSLVPLINLSELAHNDNWGTDRETGISYPIDVEIVNVASPWALQIVHQWYENKNLPKQGVDTPPTGEVTHSEKLASGLPVQIPNAKVISWLQDQDPRVHYFPIDRDRAQAAPPGYAFTEGVADTIAQRIYEDFGDKVAIRSAVAALTEGFPFWTDENDQTVSMHTVLDILNKGSDSGSDRTRTGYLSAPVNGQLARLNDQTHEWLTKRMAGVDLELRYGDAKKLADLKQTFPVMIVYDESAFRDGGRHGWRDLQGASSQRVKAIYVTDKVTSYPEVAYRPDKPQTETVAEGVGSLLLTETMQPAATSTDQGISRDYMDRRRAARAER